MQTKSYMQRFVPYALAAFLIGLVGGFSSVLGPAFVQDMNLAYHNTTWTALAQAVSAAACAPILGKLGDLIGRRRTLLLGLGVYTLGNVLTALAQSLPIMMAARFVVGIGTAAVAPVVLAFILTEFPPEAVSKGFSLYMMLSSAAVVFGPTLGGWMIAWHGWRFMVWVCVAAAASVLAVCALICRETDVRRPLAQFDGPGAVMVLVFFSLLLCIPSFAQNFGWVSAAFRVVLVGAVAALVVLVLVESRAKNPILPPWLLRRRAFVFSVLALFLTQGLMQANMTNVIVFVNLTQPEHSVISGYAISIMYLGMSLGAVLLGPLADRWEPKRVLLGSFTLTLAGCAAMLLFSEQTPVAVLALSLGLLGFGLGANATIFLKVALSGIPPEQAGAGTGTYGLFRDLAAPFGVAVFVPMFTNRVAGASLAGMNSAAAALDAIHALAVVELCCVVAGMVVVCCLPRLRTAHTEDLKKRGEDLK